MANTETALKALNQALKLEQEGLEFYQKAAQETADEKGKETFLSLADDERIHKEMVQRQLEAVREEGQYVELPDIEAPDIDLEAKLFPPEREEREEALGERANELEALGYALNVEIESYELYRQASRQTQDEAGRTMYAWLAHAEMTHFNLLMANYESLLSLGGWA